MSRWRDNPCEGCVPPVRYPGCHGKCERHAEWAARVKVEQDAEKAQKKKDDAVCSTLRMYRRKGER